MPSKSTHYDIDLLPRVSGYANATYPAKVAVRDWNRVWSTTSGYKQKKKTFAELPTNPMTEFSLSRNHNWSSVRLDKWVGGANPVVSVFVDFYCGHWIPPQPTLPTSGHSALYNKCLSKMPKRVNGENFNSLVFFAEFAKTKRMVLELAKDISLQFTRMQRSRVKDLSSLSGRAFREKHGFAKSKFRSDSGFGPKSGLSKREIQNVWLEYRYGWRLLVKDIQDALKALHDTRVRRPVFRVTATSHEETVQKFTVSNLQLTDRYAPPGQVLNDLSCERVYKEEVTIKVRYRDTTPLLGTLQQYGITNPTLLVWELIPYSFVFDWLVPVGDYLSTIDTFVGKEFVSGSVSYITDDFVRSTPINVRVDPTNSGWVYAKAIKLSPNTASRRHYRREPLTSFPSASLPSLDVNLNTQRVTDAISLVTQKMRR